jgi:hypothetical protein
MLQFFRRSQQQSSTSNYNQDPVGGDHEEEEDTNNIPRAGVRSNFSSSRPNWSNHDHYGDHADDDNDADDENHEEEEEERFISRQQEEEQNTNNNLLDSSVRIEEPTEGTRLLNPRQRIVGYDGSSHRTHRHDSHLNANQHDNYDYGDGSSDSQYQQSHNVQLHPGNGRHDHENQSLPQQQPRQQQQPPDHENVHNRHNHNQANHQEDEQDIGLQIANLTSRLRILFYTLYIPIIPLSVLLFALLLQLLIKAANSPPCSYPLRFFALASLLLFLYTPNHRTIKRLLFNYSRERDGAIRPRSVRIYDQFFHMICLMYIYLDMVLVQSCREDIVNNVSTCTTTCPDLYSWFQRFDIVLRIFVGVLVLPLVCLPFVYIWIMRRIHTTEALWRLQQGLEGGGGEDGGRMAQGEEDLMAAGGGAKVKDIMENLRRVRLVPVPSEEDGSKVRVVGVERVSWTGDDRLRDWDAVKDCCICMCEFECEGGGSSVKNGESSLVQEDGIVQTRCGHLFHKACIGGWIGGRNWEDSLSLLGSNARARRRCCPLCREDLAISDGSDAV